MRPGKSCMYFWERTVFLLFPGNFSSLLLFKFYCYIMSCLIQFFFIYNLLVIYLGAGCGIISLRT